MIHTIEGISDNKRIIKWSLSTSGAGYLVLMAEEDGERLPAIMINPNAEVTICRPGSNLGLTYKGQVR